MVELELRRYWLQSIIPEKLESYTFKRTPQRCFPGSQNLKSSSEEKEKIQQATVMFQARENEKKDKKFQA